MTEPTGERDRDPLNDEDGADIVALHFHRAMRRRMEQLHEGEGWIDEHHVWRAAELVALNDARKVADRHGFKFTAWLLLRLYTKLRTYPLPTQAPLD